MQHDDLTPEVMIALAAGDLRASVAERARALIAADEDLAMEYEGVKALVQELGPGGALAYLDEAHDRNLLRKDRTSGTSKGRVIALWTAVSAVAASVLVVLWFTFNGPTGDPDRLAMAVLDTPPDIEQVRGGTVPAWAMAYDRGDHQGTIDALRAGGVEAPRECLVMGFSLLRIDPPVPDSALVYFERAAQGGIRYRDQALLYAGAVAFRMGDREKAVRLLSQSSDQRAADLRALLEER